MRIAIFGTGGVGGYFGGRLAQAGEDVIFIARGAHLEAIRSKGLLVESIKGDFEFFRRRPKPTRLRSGRSTWCWWALKPGRCPMPPGPCARWLVRDAGRAPPKWGRSAGTACRAAGCRKSRRAARPWRLVPHRHPDRRAGRHSPHRHRTFYRFQPPGRLPG